MRCATGRRSGRRPDAVSGALAELFSSKVRAAVLGHVLARPRQAFGLTDLSRALGLPVSSLQHECYKLERLGVLAAARTGGTRRYRPDPAFSLLAPLAALVLRDLGPAVALPAAFEDIEPAGIAALFLAGDPLANGPAPTLVVVGDLPLERLEDLESRGQDAVSALGGRQPELGYFRRRDWDARIAAGDPLAAELRAAPRIDLLPAPPDELAGGRRPAPIDGTLGAALATPD